MGITIREVAKAAGVSIATVSKVINQSPTISEGTATKVQQVMKELNYYPNQRAQNLARQRSNHIALLSPLSSCDVIASVEFVKIMTGIVRILENKSYTVSIHSATDETGSEILDKLIQQKKIDGVIVMGSILTDKMEQIIRDNRIPYIIMGNPAIRTELVCMIQDRVAMGELAAEYINELHGKKVAVCGQSLKNVNWNKIILGLRQKLRCNQIFLKREYMAQDGNTEKKGYVMMERMLLQECSPDFILCENFDVTRGVIKALQKKAMIPGKDVHLLTFGPIEISKTFEYPISCIYMDFEKIGENLAKCIISEIKSPDQGIRVKSLNPILYKAIDRVEY